MDSDAITLVRRHYIAVTYEKVSILINVMGTAVFSSMQTL